MVNILKRELMKQINYRPMLREDLMNFQRGINIQLSENGGYIITVITYQKVDNIHQGEKTKDGKIINYGGYPQQKMYIAKGLNEAMGIIQEQLVNL
jgi:hypothetical protein